MLTFKPYVLIAKNISITVTIIVVVHDMNLIKWLSLEGSALYQVWPEVWHSLKEIWYIIPGVAPGEG